MAFDLKKLLTDVFETQPGETVVVACDLPTVRCEDNPLWEERRVMAQEWRDAFADLGRQHDFQVLPLLTFPATGANGADLPQKAIMDGREVGLEEVVLKATVAAFLTQFSATAALDVFCRQKDDFRAASLPGLEKRMEKTALAADYREVARRCKILEEKMRDADAVDVRFSTGESCTFDLRYRKPEADDGYLPRFKKGDRIINLPSGETFIVPYEGELAGLPSLTNGSLPISRLGEHVVLDVEGNRISRIRGDGPEATRLRQFFAMDLARANIAEVAFGCNEWAMVTGNTLEDEKAGFHWAYGRSDHLGGVTGVKSFQKTENVVHQDIVYAKGNPIQVAEAVVVRGGQRVDIIRDGDYVVF